MSCKTPYVKIGDSLDIPIQWVEETAQGNIGIPITSEITIDCLMKVSNSDQVIVPEIQKYPDQTTDAGWFLIKVPATQTSQLKPCTITMDIKLTIGASVKHSKSFSFLVVESITP